MERSEFTMDEMESSNAAPAKTVSGNDLKLDAPDLPDSIRGKSASEVAAQIAALQDSVRLSEVARLATQASADVAARPAAPAPVVEPEKETVYTREQLAEMMQADPVATVALITDNAIKQAAKHFETRLGGITTGAVSSAEAIARSEYKTEFELFGKEIGEFKNGLRDPSVLSTQQGWDDMISYIRGKKGNLEKYIDHKTKGSAEAVATAARASQAADTGFSPSPTTEPLPKTGTVVLDATAKEIAKNFIDAGVFKDEAEYAKWMQTGGAK